MIGKGVYFLLSETGECEQFSYSGCRGNNNRFMSEAACSATCRHAAIRRTTDITCKLFIGPHTSYLVTLDLYQLFLDEGDCGERGNSTLARWGYNQFTRR